jgi:hypothetical protein
LPDVAEIKAAFAASPQLSGQVNTALDTMQQASGVLTTADAGLNTIMGAVQQYVGGVSHFKVHRSSPSFFLRCLRAAAKASPCPACISSASRCLVCVFLGIPDLARPLNRPFPRRFFHLFTF